MARALWGDMQALQLFNEIVMFMSGIRDQVATLLFPYKYDRLEREK